MKTTILILTMVILTSCASAPPQKDDRVIVVYPPEATAKGGSPINISYNGTQSNQESNGRPDGYSDNLSNGVNYKRQPAPVPNLQSNDSRTVQVPIEPLFHTESDRNFYEMGYNKGLNQGR